MPQPPIAPRKDHTWSRPTGNVDDPWAWLRNRDDPDTLAYLRAENAHADAWFAQCSPSIDELFEEIKSRVVETDMSVPVFHGGWWYATRTVEGLAYPIHCRGRAKESAREEVLLDENVEATGHEYFALGVAEVSHDHSLLAWSRDTDGGEQYEMFVRDLSSGKDLEDHLTDTSYGGAAFSADNRYLFYVVNDEMMRPFKVMRHEIGTPQSADDEVFVDDDERFFVGLGLTRSGTYIVIESGSRTSSECHLLEASRPLEPLVCVRPRRENVEYSVDHWGDRFVVLTNEDAQDFRVMTAPEDDPGTWTTLDPHVPGRRIVDIDAFADFLAIQEWENAQPRVRLLHRDGSSRVIPVLSEPHDVELGSNPEWTTTSLRIRYQSLVTPPTVAEHDVSTGSTSTLKTTPVPGVDLDVYEAVREWATADDGTRVPLDIVRKKTTSLDGTAPGVLYGYGSYEYSIAPSFSVTRFSLLDRGWVWALAHPRGGGELGRGWYDDGKLLAKRNTFTDTIACARHLAAHRFVRERGIAIYGGSAGGLLVGACLNMAPDAFGAAVAAVPFVDVVTTMSDPSLPLTVTEWEEWGDPRKEPWASYMLSYSPYDNVSDNADYPPLYVTAGLNDPRVSYHEPTKWVAKFRSLPRPPEVYFRCEMGAGHGGPSGRYEHWRDEAHVLAFMLRQLSSPPAR
jgi:oligopeptidase B